MVERDRWGRYILGDVPHTRVTTIASTLSDQAGLTKWKLRQVIAGLADRPELLQRANVADKASLDVVAAEALERSGSSDKARIGTALHAQLADGEPKIVATVDGLLNGLGLHRVGGMSERICSRPHERIAGTFDLLVSDGNESFVADLKTGSIDHNKLAIVAQLALYASSSLIWDEDGKASEPMPSVSQDVAYVLHLPLDGPPSIHQVFLEQGHEAIELALRVRNIRKTSTKTFTDVTPRELLPRALSDLHTEAQEWIRQRIVDLRINEPKALQILAERWPDGVPTARAGFETEEQVEQIAQLIEQIEKEQGLSFSDSVCPFEQRDRTRTKERAARLPADLCTLKLDNRVSRLQAHKLAPDLEAAEVAYAGRGVEVDELLGQCEQASLDEPWTAAAIQDLRDKLAEHKNQQRENEKNGSK